MRSMAVSQSPQPWHNFPNKSPGRFASLSWPILGHLIFPPSRKILSREAKNWSMVHCHFQACALSPISSRGQENQPIE